MEKQRGLKYTACIHEETYLHYPGLCHKHSPPLLLPERDPLSEIWTTLKKTNLALAFTPLIFIATAISLSSFRWARVAGATVRFGEAFTANLIGMFANNVLPLRLGEVVKGYVLSRKKGLSFTYACSTVVLDRFFDLTGLLLLTLIFFPPGEPAPCRFQGDSRRYRYARALRSLDHPLESGEFCQPPLEKVPDHREIVSFTAHQADARGAGKPEAHRLAHDDRLFRRRLFATGSP